MGMDAVAGGMMAGMSAGGGLSIVEVLKYIIITLGGGALLGFVVGKIFSSIRYPNPEKRQLFSTWQKIVVLVVCVASIGLIAGALLYKPEQPDAAAGDPAMSEAVGEEAAAGGESGGSASAGSGGSVRIGGGGATVVMLG